MLTVQWLSLERVHLIPIVALFLNILLSLPATNAKCVFVGHPSQATVKRISDRIAPLDQKKFKVVGMMGKYIYNIGVCTAIMENANQDDIAVLQIKSVDKTSTVIGNITNTYILDGDNWVSLEYRNTYNKKKALLMIICDESATDDNPQIQIISQNIKKTDNYYVFTLLHPSVCKKQPSISVGSIIVIVFISIVVAYFVIGFLYMRFVLEAKGLEQIPNYGFWQDFGNLLADGCNLTCRSGSSTQQKTYKGIGDDQLEDEDERDEHLLPM
ncbi:cation-dependent mannose-6-phosphate receptor-like [Octopus vulgaris]|nr:cation-dependent mannose-6-phosphate receptor-like [Octopus vulgaris]